MSAVSPRAARASNLARRIAGPAVLALPVALLYARAGAEIIIAGVGLLFLIHSLARREAAWLRGAFARTAAAWWCCQIIASLAGTGGLGLALAALRLPLFALALRHWLATGETMRRRLMAVLTLAAGWIILQCWQQYLTGQNMFGQERWADGALTGPFNRPRAGPELILLLFPVGLPIVAHGLQSKAVPRRLAAIALAAASCCTVLLIGQRMPSLLIVLGLGMTCLFMPRLRLATAGMAIAAGLTLAAMPHVAPAAYDKLVVHTSDQLHHFATSAYGEIWARAAHIAARNPWLGVGVNGFRRVCNNAAYGPPAIEACNLHPHNYYLEAAVDGGVPLLLCFAAMVASALAILWRGLRRQPDAGRAGFLIGAALAFFPVASTSAFTAMPNAGWIFLLLGLGFAGSDTNRR